MRTQDYSKGEIITNEGDPSDSAYFLKSGSVEVLVRMPEGERVVGQHSAGDFFGEMGLILEAPRMATVRALTDVVVEVYDLGSFEKEVIDAAARRSAYLPNLFERMRLLCGLLRESMSFDAEGAIEEPGFHGVEMPFLPTGTPFGADGSDMQPGAERQVGVRLKSRRPLDGSGRSVDLDIRKFPFYIGRTSQSKILVENDFYIDDAKPHKVSRGHCSIEQRANGFFVRDRFSSLGTTVNGQVIGKSARNFIAPLETGENELILGDDADRCSFVLEVS